MLMASPASAVAAAKAREKAVDILDRDVQMQLAASLVHAHTSATAMAQQNFPSVSDVGVRATVLGHSSFDVEECLLMHCCAFYSVLYENGEAAFSTLYPVGLLSLTEYAITSAAIILSLPWTLIFQSALWVFILTALASIRHWLTIICLCCTYLSTFVQRIKQLNDAMLANEALLAATSAVRQPSTTNCYAVDLSSHWIGQSRGLRALYLSIPSADDTCECCVPQSDLAWLGVNS